MFDPETLSYIKDGGLLAAFSMFLYYLWKTQQAFLATLLKFQETMDAIVHKCNRV